MLNKVPAGNIDDVENSLKAKFRRESDENYTKVALYMYAENKPAMKRNETVLNELPGELYTTEAHYIIPGDCKYPLAYRSCSESKANKHKSLSKVAAVKNRYKSNVNS